MDLRCAERGKHAVGPPRADLLGGSLVDCGDLVVLYDGPAGGQPVVAVSSASQEMTCVRSLASRCAWRLRVCQSAWFSQAVGPDLGYLRACDGAVLSACWVRPSCGMVVSRHGDGSTDGLAESLGLGGCQ